MKQPPFLISLQHAVRGVRIALTTQRNARVHAAIATLVILAGAALRLSWSEWALLALAIGLVCVTELLNTAIEDAVDLVTTEHHPLAGRAKDIAAGAVLLASLTAIVVGLLVLGPRLIHVLLPLLFTLPD